MSVTNGKHNCEEITLDAIKNNIQSIVLNENTNVVQFVLKRCKLVNIDYDNEEVKLSLNLDKIQHPDVKQSVSSEVDEDNMSSKLELFKESSNEMKEEDIKEDKKHLKKQTNRPKNIICNKPKTKKKKSNNKSAKVMKQIKKTKSLTPVGSIINSQNKSKRKKKRKDFRQRAKTTNDMDIFDCITAHDKWSYYSTQLTAKQLIRCFGFADIKCRYKYAHEMKFGSKLRREDVMEFKVPIDIQIIRAYAVEDCLADGTNGEIVKSQGGVGKRNVKLFIKSQMGKGVHMKLHVWYK